MQCQSMERGVRLLTPVRLNHVLIRLTDMVDMAPPVDWLSRLLDMVRCAAISISAASTVPLARLD